MKVNFAPVKEKSTRVRSACQLFTTDGVPKVKSVKEKSAVSAPSLVYHLGRIKTALCGAPVIDTEENGPFHTYPLGPNVLKIEDFRLMHISHRCHACMAKLN